MRFMILVKATQDSEAGRMPTEQLLSDMMAFNEDLTKAGVMLGGDGLKPSRFGARVRFDGVGRSVVAGPFGEPNDLVAGYWIWECKDLAEAVEWVKRCPNPMFGPSEIEIRPFYEAEDFGAALTPEIRAQEERLREQLDRKNTPDA